ncbi:MAG TPA: MBL fold metallo-hydrolase [Steroidobacteraceae bacterium]|nr:MBL fold metallo-hydrolase [Steroidobacteraceae bacterium]
MNRTAIFFTTVLATLAGAMPARAAEGLPKSPITRLILLGTQGGPRGSVDRAQPANVLVVRGKPYLIDAGNGVVHQLDLAGIPFTSIRQIFITHNHDDHDADWGTLMGRAWTSGQHEPMTVYGPRGTKSMRKGFLQYFAPNAAAHYMEDAVNIPPEKVILAKEIPRAGGLVYQDENIRVTAVENCHYHFSKGDPGYHWQQSFAFRFETPDRVIVFSGDTGPCGNVLPDFARGADLLVHEAIDLPAIEATVRSRHDGSYSEPGQLEALMKHMRTEHSTPEEVGRVAKAAGVKMVVLNHLVTGTRTDGDADYIDAVHRNFSGPVVVGRDLMEF